MQKFPPLWISFISLILSGICNSVYAEDLSQYVNPWIGTSGGFFWPGNTFPGATVPNGAVRLSPDTLYGHFPQTALNSKHMMTSGYSYKRDRVIGFSHTRLSGAGISEGGVLRVLPVTQYKDFSKIKTSLKLDHTQENGSPGYYSIRFKDDHILAELTSSLHCGFHRYSSEDPKKNINILIDGNSRFFNRTKPGNDAKLELDLNSNHFQGNSEVFAYYSKRFNGVKTYYYGEFSLGAHSVGLWQDKNWVGASQNKVSGKDFGAGIVFPKSAGQVELKVCMSSISVENAKLNFEAEAQSVSFDQARDFAHRRWEEKLQKIVITTPQIKDKTIFYTALYHSFIMPTRYADTNGEYLGFDQQIHQEAGFKYVTDLSLWDTFRTVHPLYTLIDPELQNDSLNSLLEMSRHLGVLPRWPYGPGETWDMLGAPANFLFSESFLKGFKSFDAERALELMHQEALGNGTDPQKTGRDLSCAHFGYCPVGRTNQSVSKTLEYSWADGAALELAQSLGREDLVTFFKPRSQMFKNIWDPKSKFFRPRNEWGSFLEFSPETISHLDMLGLGENASAYTEGSPWQWRFYAPHDPKSLIGLFGGEAEFVKNLEYFMEGAKKKPNSLLPGPYYWHGNEHDIHAIYLFNEAGRPDLAQKWARWAMASQYNTRPSGLPGNDDAGTTSAWYVFSAVGIYPQAGTQKYWIGSPIIESATLSLGQGHFLKIKTYDGQLPKNSYVQRMSLNGQPLCTTTLQHQQLIDATLEFWMGSKPVTHYCH